MQTPDHSPDASSARTPPPEVRSAAQPAQVQAGAAVAAPAGTGARELGGPAGLEPTRYGDWERKGRCIDF